MGLRICLRVSRRVIMEFVCYLHIQMGVDLDSGDLSAMGIRVIDASKCKKLKFVSLTAGSVENNIKANNAEKSIRFKGLDAVWSYS